MFCAVAIQEWLCENLAASGLRFDDPLDSLHDTVALDTRSWSDTDTAAWVYGIIVGWDADSLVALAARFGWTMEDQVRLTAMHEGFRAMRSGKV